MIDTTTAPIPDWIVRAAGWLQLALFLLLALALLYLWVELTRELAGRLNGWCKRRR